MAVYRILKAIEPEELAPVLADLGIEAEAVRAIDLRYAPETNAPTLKRAMKQLEGPEDTHVAVSVEGLGQNKGFVGRAIATRALGLMAPDSVALVFLPGEFADRELAAWREALWPELFVAHLYHLRGGRLVRRSYDGQVALEGEPELEGTVLVCQSRRRVLDPEVTVEKFDMKASGWNGNPGSPGYGHFRWMRRFVGKYTPVEPGQRVLDFGCGAGWVGIEAARGVADVELCAFDPSPAMVELAGQNAQEAGIERFTGRTGFGHAPPFPRDGEAPYERVFSSGVVSFAPDFEPWMEGLVGTVAPGGRLVIGDINPDSRGMKSRRGKRPVLPVRELNAQRPKRVREWLEARGYRLLDQSGYQLTWPIPQAMYFDEVRLKGALSRPLLLVNQGLAALDRSLGARLGTHFDSWVMSFQAP